MVAMSSSHQPRISVVIASYNHARFVQACLQSVLSQGVADLEVVVTDDGSTDGTPERVLAMADPRIRFHAFAENRGACVALNDAISRSHGRFIAVLNSDDLFLPGKLTRQLAFLESHPEVGAVFGWPTFINEQGDPFHDPAHKDHAVFRAANRPRQQWLRQFFDNGNALCHPTALIRREVYAEVGLYDPRLAQVPDLDQWMRVCTRFEIHVLPERFTAFRIRDQLQNASAARPEVVVRDAWERARILTTYLHLTVADQALVFPEFASQTGTYAEKLARHALNQPYPFYHRFALDAWFDALGDNSPKEGDPAAYARFIAATGSTDLHCIYP